MMTNREALERLGQTGLLTADESVTLARGGEGGSVSITMAHPVALMGTAEDAEVFVRRLRLAYDGKTLVYLVYANGNILQGPIEEFNSQQWKEGAILWFDSRKAVTKEVTPYSLQPLLDTMDALLAEDGCPWDKAQTHESLRTYFLQETYEVIDAIDKKDWQNLCEELGDVLYQIVFHARLAEREGHFTMQDVVDGISGKMRRRHPFIFDKDWKSGVTSDALTWEKRKRAEKNRKYLLSGVSKALPSLLLSCIIQKKVGSSGLEALLPETGREEIQTLFRSVHAAETTPEKETRAGRLLFTIGRVLREEGIEPELALRRFALRFMETFHAFEVAWEKEGHRIDRSSPGEVLEAWRRFIDHPVEPQKETR